MSSSSGSSSGSSTSSSSAGSSSTSKGKPDQIIKELSKLKSNRYCFDCGRTGSQNQVNLSIGTFVCSSCAGLLRNFGYSVKTISLSAFTPQQATDLEKGGNKRAEKTWKARLDRAQLKIDIDNPAEVEKLMKAVYTEKKYYKEAGADKKEKKTKKGKDKDKDQKKAADEDDDDDSEDDEEEEKDKKKKKGKADKAEKAGGKRQAGEAAANGNAPKEAAADSWGNSSAAFPAAEKPKDAIDFLSNMEFHETPIPAGQGAPGGKRLSFNAFAGGAANGNGADGSSASAGSGAVVSLRSGDDPAVQFLLNQLKLAAKQFDLIPAELKASVHTALNVYEKELQGAKESGKSQKGAPVDHFLDLDVQDDDAASGNPFDDNYDENDQPAMHGGAAFNPFGGSGTNSPPIGVSSPPPAVVSVAPTPASVFAANAAVVNPVSAINPYAVGVGVAVPGMNPMLQQQMLIQQAQAQMQQLQLQQNLMIKQQQQQAQYLQQQQAQAQLFNVPSAAAAQGANVQGKQDIFAALNPF